MRGSRSSALLSIALLFADTRFRYLEGVRQVVAVILYPLQRAVQLPGEALACVGDYFASKRALADDNAKLKQRSRRAGAGRAGLRADSARRMRA